MKVTVSDNIKSATSAMKALPGGVNRAVAATLNRVAEGMKTEAARIIAKTYNIKNKDVKSLGNVKVTKANTSKLEILLTSKGGNIPLIKFSTNPNAPRRVKMLKASVKRGGKKPVPGAFVATMKSGHTGVFERMGAKRNPIGEKYGPAVPIMMNNQDVADHLNEQANIRISKRLDQEMKRVLGGLKMK